MAPRAPNQDACNALARKRAIFRESGRGTFFRFGDKGNKLDRIGAAEVAAMNKG